MEQDFTSGNLRRLSDTEFDVADDEPDVRGWTVVDADGQQLGEVDELIVDTDAMKVRYFELGDTGSNDGTGPAYVSLTGSELDRDNRRVVLRAGRSGILTNRSLTGASATDMSSGMAGEYAHRSTEAQMPRGMDTSMTDHDRITRAEEQVRIGKRTVQAGEIRVGKHVETERVHDDVTVMREQVHVERRPVTDMNATAEIRASAEEIVVPITEEEVVIEKRPVVKEELVISKEQVQETRPVDVEVRREEFDIRDERTGGIRDERIGRSTDDISDDPALRRNR
jgi:uncharacterized protein (TIGR02271 family)